jgi:hypothetical protein
LGGDARGGEVNVDALLSRLKKVGYVGSDRTPDSRSWDLAVLSLTTVTVFQDL